MPNTYACKLVFPIQMFQYFRRRLHFSAFHYKQYVYTAQNLRYNNYGAPWWTIFVDELSECRPDVGLLVRCFRLQSSKIDVSTFEDRCVDFRRSTPNAVASTSNIIFQTVRRASVTRNTYIHVHANVGYI